MNRRLYRSASDRKIGGVAAGTAAYFDIDVSVSRVIWLLLAIFTGGTFVIVYLVMWAIVPEEPWTPPLGTAQTAEAPAPSEGADGEASSGAAAAAPPAQATTSWTSTSRVDSGPGPHVIFGVILILIGGWFLAQQFLPWLNFGTLWPIGLVVIGLVILLAALRRRS